MLGDALCEGFSRVRREVSQVCRPHSAPNNDVAAGVPLKFAEEDKDFGEALVPGAGEHGESTWSSRDTRRLRGPRRRYHHASRMSRYRQRAQA